MTIVCGFRQLLADKIVLRRRLTGAPVKKQHMRRPFVRRSFGSGGSGQLHAFSGCETEGGRAERSFHNLLILSPQSNPNCPRSQTMPECRF